MSAWPLQLSCEVTLARQQQLSARLQPPTHRFWIVKDATLNGDLSLFFLLGRKVCESIVFCQMFKNTSSFW